MGVERGGGRCGLVLREPGEGVVVEVVGVLVDGPGDRGGLVDFGCCFPAYRVAVEVSVVAACWGRLY